MGQQQLILIIAGVIVVGIAIAFGIYLFTATSALENRDAMINDLMNLGQYAYRYKLRPEPLGGGGLAYTGFQLPGRLASNENADYSVSVSPSSIRFTAVSKFGFGTIVGTLDSSGVLGNYTYTGDFN